MVCTARRGCARWIFAIQANNVEIDDRGYIYIVDRANTGMHVLELSGEARKVAKFGWLRYQIPGKQVTADKRRWTLMEKQEFNSNHNASTFIEGIFLPFHSRCSLCALWQKLLDLDLIRVDRRSSVVASCF